jgi:hypothetical protein
MQLTDSDSTGKALAALPVTTAEPFLENFAS